MTKSGDIEISPHPTHAKKVVRFFLFFICVMLVGIILLGVGLKYESLLVQYVAWGVMPTGFIGLIVTYSMCSSACCPKCGKTMIQGWNSKEHRSDGVFFCGSCKSKFSTKATYGMD